MGAIAGIAFSALYFLSTASFDPKVEATDAELVAFFSDSSNLRDNVISMYLVLASIPCFLLFLVTLRGRLATADDEASAGSTFLLASGICFAATLLIASVARGFIAQSVKFGDEPLPGPDTLRTITLFSTTMYAIVTMPAAAITMAATGVLILRTRAMAAWSGWSALAAAGVTAALTPLLIATFALPLLFLWVTATSIELWRTREADQLPRTASAPRLARMSDA
jgi:hypothetical protein